MSTFKSPAVSRAVWLPGLLVMAGLAAAALAQYGDAGVKSTGVRGERPRTEYLQQEVQADAIVPTLNDLDAQGWDLFQIVPAWTFQNNNGEATLVAKSYHVFGRRDLKPGK